MVARLYVGLGNPVDLLKNTRHNIGYGVIDSFLKRFKEFTHEVNAFKGLYLYDDGENRCYLLKPYCSINDSGSYIRQVIDYLKLESNDVSVFYDEMDVELGAYQKELVVMNGGFVGHHGVESIVDSLDGYFFINPIGIGKPCDGDIYNHVLGDFKDIEIAKVLNIIRKSVDYIESCVGI